MRHTEGVTLDAHHVIERAFDDERWSWGNDPGLEAIEVADLCHLLEAEPDRVNRPDARGRRLLHAVVEELGVVDEDNPDEGERLLLIVFDQCIALGADVNATDEDGQTALFYAPSPAMVKRLIAAGANPNATTNNGATALMHLVQSPELVSALLAAGADREHRDASGKSARDLATYFDASETLRLLGPT